jgi:hypothetical protein
MIRRSLAVAVFAVVATFSPAQPSLPSSFQAKTVHSPEKADIFVRWGGRGPVVVLVMDMRKTAIRGRRWRQILCRITRSSCPIFVE